MNVKIDKNPSATMYERFWGAWQCLYFPSLPSRPSEDPCLILVSIQLVFQFPETFGEILLSPGGAVTKLIKISVFEYISLWCSACNDQLGVLKVSKDC